MDRLLGIAGRLALLAAFALQACAADAEQPNIVLIISDDQAYHDFGFMGHKDIQTSHLDDEMKANSAGSPTP